MAENTIKKVATRESYGNALKELGEEFPNLVVLDADLAAATKTGIFKKAYPDRHIDCGIAESNMMGVAAGLSLVGKIPFVSSFAMFAAGRAFEQVRNSVGYPHLNVKIGATHAGITVGEDGATHHGAYDLAYLRTVPGMTVASGRNEHMLRNLLYTAQSGDYGPFAIRYPRGAGKLTDWQNDMRVLEPGRGEKLVDGGDVAVLTIGPVADDAAQAVAEARKRGVNAALYDMIYLKPIDEEILGEVARKNCPVITVEDGTVNGGLGGAVAEWLASKGYTRSVTRLGIPDRFIPQGTPAQQHQMSGFDADSILEAIMSAAAGGKEPK